MYIDAGILLSAVAVTATAIVMLFWLWQAAKRESREAASAGMPDVMGETSLHARLEKADAEKAKMGKVAEELEAMIQDALADHQKVCLELEATKADLAEARSETLAGATLLSQQRQARREAEAREKTLAEHLKEAQIAAAEWERKCQEVMACYETVTKKWEAGKAEAAVIVAAHSRDIAALTAAEKKAADWEKLAREVERRLAAVRERGNLLASQLSECMNLHSSV